MLVANSPCWSGLRVRPMDILGYEPELMAQPLAKMDISRHLSAIHSDVGCVWLISLRMLTGE